MRRLIISSAVVTSPGTYSYRHISVQEAKDWYLASQNRPESYVGYSQTAAELSIILGTTIPMNRKIHEMNVGDEALVFRLKFKAGMQRIDPKDKGRLPKALVSTQFELGILKKEAI